MYSWGPDDTSTWRNPGGYDYDSARAPYLDRLARSSSARGGRSYATGSSPKMDMVDPKGKEISSESANPIVIGVDVTGSMSSWPGEIFDRLPLLYQTLSQYRDDVEISFSAIGDAYVDDFPLQVNDFGKGVNLEDHLKALYPEGGGGGQIMETYELFGYYMNEHCKIPNATSPFLLMFGDEKFYDSINPNQVRHYIGDSLEEELDSENMWTNLMQKFDVYLLHKPYGYGGSRHVDDEVRESWENVLGKQRIIDLPSEERAVDVALGLIAKQWGEYGDFSKSLDARHPDDDEQKSVHHSLRYLPSPSQTHSVTDRTVGKESKSLLDD